MAIIAVIAVIGYLIYAVDGWGEAWKHTINGAKLLFQAYVESVKLYFNTMVNTVMIGINLIKKGWYEFKESVGIGNSSENQSMIAKINADTNARKQAIIDGAKKVKDTALKAKDEFVLAGGSLHSNGKGFGTMTTDIKKKLGLEDKGIAKPKVPGIGDKGKSTGLDNTKDNSKTNEAIATGGTKNTVVNITVGEMVGIKAGTVNGSNETIEKSRKRNGR